MQVVVINSQKGWQRQNNASKASCRGSRTRRRWPCIPDRHRPTGQPHRLAPSASQRFLSAWRFPLKGVRKGLDLLRGHGGGVLHH